MTYRRLFHILLAGSTLVLATVWWLSFFWMSHASLSSRKVDRQISGNVFHGTVQIGVLVGDSNPRTFIAGNIPSSLMNEDHVRLLSPWGSFHCGVERLGLGKFHGIAFPIWAAYLFINGSAWGLMRVMEKRSGSRNEKELAGKHAAATLGKEPE